MVHVGFGGFGGVSSSDTRSVMLSSFTWLLFVVLSTPGAGGSHFCHLGVLKRTPQGGVPTSKRFVWERGPCYGHLGGGGCEVQRACASQASEVTVKPGGTFSSSWTSTLPFLPTKTSKGFSMGMPLESHCSPPTLPPPEICLSTFIQLAPAW